VKPEQSVPRAQPVPLEQLAKLGLPVKLAPPELLVQRAQSGPLVP
jgi:hypothetical protein